MSVTPVGGGHLALVTSISKHGVCPLPPPVSCLLGCSNVSVGMRVLALRSCSSGTSRRKSACWPSPRSPPPCGCSEPPFSVCCVLRVLLLPFCLLLRVFICFVGAVRCTGDSNSYFLCGIGQFKAPLPMPGVFLQQG